MLYISTVKAVSLIWSGFFNSDIYTNFAVQYKNFHRGIVSTLLRLFYLKKSIKSIIPLIKSITKKGIDKKSMNLAALSQNLFMLSSLTDLDQSLNIFDTKKTITPFMFFLFNAPKSLRKKGRVKRHAPF